jgi:hypothetical protein
LETIISADFLFFLNGPSESHRFLTPLFLHTPIGSLSTLVPTVRLSVSLPIVSTVGLDFYFEDGSSIFLLNVDILLSDYMMPHYTTVFIFTVTFLIRVVRFSERIQCPQC